MKRRKLLLQTMHGAGIAAIGLVFSPLVSSLSLLQAGQSERLVEQLKAGLKVRKPAEKLFVEHCQWFSAFFNMLVRKRTDTPFSTSAKR